MKRITLLLILGFINNSIAQTTNGKGVYKKEQLEFLSEKEEFLKKKH